MNMLVTITLIFVTTVLFVNLEINLESKSLQEAFASRYFNCVKDSVEINKLVYEHELGNIDTKLQLYMGSKGIKEVDNSNVSDLNEYMVTESLNYVSQVGKCLKEGGIKNLETVAKLDKNTKQVLIYDPVAITVAAPDFAKYVLGIDYSNPQKNIEKTDAKPTINKLNKSVTKSQSYVENLFPKPNNELNADWKVSNLKEYTTIDSRVRKAFTASYEHPTYGKFDVGITEINSIKNAIDLYSEAQLKQWSGEKKINLPKEDCIVTIGSYQTVFTCQHNQIVYLIRYEGASSQSTSGLAYNTALDITSIIKKKLSEQDESKPIDRKKMNQYKSCDKYKDNLKKFESCKKSIDKKSDNTRHSTAINSPNNVK